MKGLELAQKFYEECRPRLFAAIPEIMANAAIGLAGEGSECFACDDDFSADHDYGPGFCIWLDDDILRKSGQQISQALSSLPDSFMGRPVLMNLRGRRGPIGIKAFYKNLTGLDKMPETLHEWRMLPESRLAAATNGEVFEDLSGQFSAWRQKLLDYYPQDVWLKKLAARVMTMAQTGQYNLIRSLKRGDGAAAMLACARFAEAALSFVFLLNRRYMPFYKWSSRLSRDLPILGGQLGELLDLLAAHPLRNSADLAVAEKVEEFCDACAAHLRAIGLSNAQDAWLWAHGPEIIAHVRDSHLKSLNLLED